MNQFLKRTIDLDYVPPVSNPSLLILSVSKALDLDKCYITGSSRKREHLDARNITIGLIILANPKMSHEKIAGYFNRERTTIINSMEVFNSLLGDYEFRIKLSEVIKFLN